MSDREIDNVNVVTYACSTMCGIVTTEDREFVQSAYGNLGDVGKQVVGYSVGIFTDISTFVRTDGIETSQQRNIPITVGELNIG
jgi:hypothetical protein